MALTHAHLNYYIRANGPYLFHATYPDRIDAIMQMGLLPAQMLGINNYEGRMQSRQSHVYIGSEDYITGMFANRSPVLRIDLRKLDLSLMDSDEDVWDPLWCKSLYKLESIRKHCPDWYQDNGQVSDESPLTPLPKDCDFAEPLSDWAEANSHIIDSPAQVEYSLWQGAIAYRGIIHPRAIDFNPRYVIAQELEDGMAEDAYLLWSRSEQAA